MIPVSAAIPTVLEVAKYVYKISQKWGKKTFTRGTDIRETHEPETKEDGR